MSDARYIYNSSYEYPSYPQPSYDTLTRHQQHIRPASASAHSHSHSHPSPQPPPYSAPPQSPYPSSYAPAAYSIHTPAPPQWPPEPWSHYAQPLLSPVPDIPFTSAPARPDPQPPFDRAYSTHTDTPPQQATRRQDDRQRSVPLAQSLSPQTKTRRKDDKPTATLHNSAAGPPGLDFTKLVESYRIILDAAHAFAPPDGGTPARALAAGALERMLQSAAYGAQMLDAAALPNGSSPDARSAPEHDPADAKEQQQQQQQQQQEAASGEAAAKRQQQQKNNGEDLPPQEGQTCLGCKATSTPEWRRGPMGPRTLCNACGLVYAKLIKKRVRDSGRYRTAGAALDGGGGGGDDDGLASSAGSEDDGESFGAGSQMDGRSDGRGHHPHHH